MFCYVMSAAEGDWLLDTLNAALPPPTENSRVAFEAEAGYVLPLARNLGQDGEPYVHAVTSYAWVLYQRAALSSQIAATPSPPPERLTETDRRVMYDAVGMLSERYPLTAKDLRALLDRLSTKGDAPKLMTADDPRKLADLLDPLKIESLVSRLKLQKLSSELDSETLDSADWQGGYDGMVEYAREAIASLIALSARVAELEAQSMVARGMALSEAAKAMCCGCNFDWPVGYDDLDKDHRMLMHYCPENEPGKPGHICRAAAIRTLSPTPDIEGLVERGAKALYVAESNPAGGQWDWSDERLQEPFRQMMRRKVRAVLSAVGIGEK